MIDVYNITNFNYSDSELEEFLMVAIAVCGKKAIVQSKKVHELITLCRNYLGHYNSSPFELLLDVDEGSGDLLSMLKTVKIGQYDRIYNAYMEIAEDLSDGLVNLRTCSIDYLESIKGIGPKTSRFFLLHSRPHQNLAVLDTHILSFMSDKGVNVPKNTPSGKKYYELESWFLNYCKSINKNPAEADLEIWKRYSKK
jgi:hypothetical protein